MTQKQLAKKVGIHYKYLNRILNGYQPSLELALKIEEASGGQYKATKLRSDIRKLHRKISKVV